MLVSSISKERWVNFYQTAVKVGTTTSGITSIACAILGYDYTYPCAATALCACSWFSIWLNQSAQQEFSNKKSENKSDKLIDDIKDGFKKGVKAEKNRLMDVAVETGKVAIIAYAPVGVSCVAGASLNVLGTSIKSVTDKSIDNCIDSSSTMISESFS